MRVLMLATYFPKPLNPLMGNWALAQAQALRRGGVEIEVISFTAWVPRAAAITPGARAYAHCPMSKLWDGLRVWYPRWPVYPLSRLRGLIESHPEPFLVLGRPWVQRFLERRVREFAPDVVFAHHTAVNGYLALGLRRRYGLPYVITDHDFGEIHCCEDFPARRRMFEKIVRESSRMVAVASRMESEIKRLFPFAKSTVVQNGTDPIPSETARKARPRDLAGKQVIFSCGAFYERKGFPLLVDAFSLIASQYPHAELRIAGDGPTMREVRHRVEIYRLEERVRLMGKLAHAHVLQEMAWADVFALIGWDEPFATVFSEAASAGKPIVCCQDGGFTDVLEDGTHGLTVPPHNAERAAEAISRLLGDENLRDRMGAAAKQLFDSRLRWDNNAAAMIEIFREATTGSAS
jgi:glycosyltransferase involved in cell wall biosynthesis